MGGAERASDAYGAAPSSSHLSWGVAPTASGDIRVSFHLCRVLNGHLLARWHRPCPPQKSLGLEHFEVTSSATVQKSPNGGGVGCVRPMFDGRLCDRLIGWLGSHWKQGVELS